MSKYKSEYNEWFESLSLEEQKQEKERTSQKSSKSKQAATIPLAAATNTIIAGAAVNTINPPPAAVQLPTQPIYTQLPTNLTPLPPQPQQIQPTQQLQNIQMPITVPYPNMSGGGAAQPMLVKVEVVGAPGSQPHVTHAQIMPQMTYNVAQSYSPQVSYATQPFTMQVRVATKIFEGFGKALFKEFIIGREPVSTIHCTRPGTCINCPLHWAWIQYQAAHPKLFSYPMPCKLVCRFPRK